MVSDMARKEPVNETFLAAELAYAAPSRRRRQFCGPRCAYVARELCALGRRYNRLSERLCGGEEEWGRWSEAVERRQEEAHATLAKIEKRAAEVLKPWGRNARLERGDLHLAVCSGPFAKTVLL